jgi:hypothetical protein
MSLIPVEQMICLRVGSSDCRVQGQSAGFLDDWLPLAEQLCIAFGARPEGVSCPSCAFAQPFAKRYVAIVHVADVRYADSRPNDLAFRFLIVPRPFYLQLGDPFAVDEYFPPNWQSRGELPELSLPAEPLPPRTVAEVQRILQGAGDNNPGSPVLLGAAQALVDGGRIVFERPRPETELLKDLWTLLPQSTRNGLWPASFAFENTLQFDALIVSRVQGPEYDGYLTEDQAAEYPQGRYELSLQIAAEAGDQQAVDALFARRSRAQMFRLGLVLLVGMILLLVISKILPHLMR